MAGITYYSTNNKKGERVNFETALLKGMPSDFGLFMMAREDIPKICREKITAMPQMRYSDIAFEVLNPFIGSEIPKDDLKSLLDDAYREDKIPTYVNHVTGRNYIMWLTKGPTYSFKDYAARFFGRTLDYFLGKRGQKRLVVVATSGDTGGALSDALYRLDNVDLVILYPKGSISEGQRRQMTTLGGNVYAFEVNGDFDVCQALGKNLLGDKEFAQAVFGDSERLTSANSISVGRLLPQAVYPFYAHSRSAKGAEEMIASVPSGNFGDMMGTIIAKEMGLPISKIVCGVNENREFPDFLETGKYIVRPSVKSPSSAMIVSHPSNLARLIDFYDGFMYDERDPKTKKVVQEGVLGRIPDIEAMKNDIFSVSVSNPEHYATMKKVYEQYGVLLDPHGSVGWKSLEMFVNGDCGRFAVVYETADPGKFPEDVVKAIGVMPPLPAGMQKQATMEERIYSIESPADKTQAGLKVTDAQIKEAKDKIRQIFLK